MFVRRIHIAALGLALAGCATDSPTAADAPQFGLDGVPFNARCTLAIQPPTPVGPELIHQLDTGECQVAHLGRTTFVSDKIINVVAGTQTLEATFTAANGDVLRASGSGTSSMVSPGIVAFEATITFDGGTGRFADATGSAVIRGQANLAAGTSAPEMTGTIQY
jgi:hypothetical protein